MRVFASKYIFRARNWQILPLMTIFTLIIKYVILFWDEGTLSSFIGYAFRDPLGFMPFIAVILVTVFIPAYLTIMVRNVPVPAFARVAGYTLSITASVILLWGVAIVLEPDPYNSPTSSVSMIVLVALFFPYISPLWIVLTAGGLWGMVREAYLRRTTKIRHVT